MYAIICGGGSMGKFLVGYLQNQPGSNANDFDLGEDASLRADFALLTEPSGTKPIGVYCHKNATLLRPFLEFCHRKSMPVILASTGITLPTEFSVPVIEAPNLALPIIAFIKALPAFWRTFGPIRGGLKVDVVESHQFWKKSTPGTAVRMASTFEVREDDIVSVRTSAVQRQLGVRNVPRHGYHFITITGMGVEITLSTKVDGLEAYGQGLMFLAPRILERCGALENRVYPMTDFI